MKVIFTNPGEIDIDAIRTFGANIKENDSPIGFFGTGLKYAIAVLLANGCSLTLYKGDETYIFEARTKQIRGKDFKVCYMNDEALSFTTELGKNWEVWQAFRELYCNAMDENGKCFAAYAASDVIKPGFTTFVATGDKIMGAYNKRSEIILLSAPIAQTEHCDIHPGQTNHIFYKGIRVYSANKPFLFTYNLIGDHTLTEDRTLSYSWQALEAMCKGILAVEDKKLIEDWVTAGKNFQEGDMRFERNAVPSQAFMEVVKEQRIERNTRLNLSTIQFYEKAEREAMAVSFDAMKLNELQQFQLTNAIKVCEWMGATISDYPIIVSEHLGEDILGLSEDGKIFIARRAFDMGDNMVTATIYEEYVHLKHKYRDCERRMQNFLFEKLVSMSTLAYSREVPALLLTEAS